MLPYEHYLSDAYIPAGSLVGREKPTSPPCADASLCGRSTLIKEKYRSYGGPAFRMANDVSGCRTLSGGPGIPKDLLGEPFEVCDQRLRVLLGSLLVLQ